MPSISTLLMGVLVFHHTTSWAIGSRTVAADSSHDKQHHPYLRLPTAGTVHPMEHQKVRDSAVETSAFVEMESTAKSQQTQTQKEPFVGRGRGRGRAKVLFGPEEFDSSWWQAPPSVGPDSFLRGYDQHVYPRSTFGYGGMPNGGFGSGSLFWGGPSYRHSLNAPWFHDMGYQPHPHNYNSAYGPYLGLADTYGRKHSNGVFPLSSPYVSFPPPLQGDWTMPHSPRMVTAPP